MRIQVTVAGVTVEIQLLHGGLNSHVSDVTICTLKLLFKVCGEPLQIFSDNSWAIIPVVPQRMLHMQANINGRLNF